MRVTDEMVLAGAREVCARWSAACGVDPEDNWKIYSDEHKAEARAILTAALSHAAGQDGEQCRAASGEDAYVIEQMGRLLAEIAVIVNGPEPPMTRWSYHDLPEKVRALSRGAPEGKCWCLTCDPVTVRMALCPDCGNKRCPKANDHRNACTNSNEPGQPGSAYPAAIAAQRKEGE